MYQFADVSDRIMDRFGVNCQIETNARYEACARRIIIAKIVVATFGRDGYVVEFDLTFRTAQLTSFQHDRFVNRRNGRENRLSIKK